MASVPECRQTIIRYNMYNNEVSKFAGENRNSVNLFDIWKFGKQSSQSSLKETP